MSFTVRIAGIGISVLGRDASEGTATRGSLSSFLCASEPDLTLEVRSAVRSFPDLRPEECVFSTGATWSLYRRAGEHVFALTSPAAGTEPHAVAVLDDEFRHGEILSRLAAGAGRENGLLPDHLEFPLSEILMVCLLARGRGLMVHASGIDDGGRGLLFCGNSTHGKTTMARLWKAPARVLNDDRIVLRRREGRIWMYGTPWHGDHPVVSPDGVPLERLYFLAQAPANGLRPVAGVKAASMLLARCFPPFWDAPGMEYTLDFCAGLVRDVPCAELGFVPDASAVDFVRCAP